MRLFFGLFVAALVFASGHTPAAAAEYSLQPGDVLEFAVIGSPEFGRNVPIEVDGTAWFPLIGRINAKGISLATLRESVATQFETAAFSPRYDVGGVPGPIISPEQVYVGMASYRPVYVSGLSIGSGEFAYRPGLTLNQLLILAGASSARAAVGAKSPEQVQATAESLAQTYARIWRLKKQLGTASDSDYRNIFVVEPGKIKLITDLEASILATQAAEAEQEAALAAEELARIEKRIEALSKQKSSEESGSAMDQDEVDKVDALFKKGLVPATRLAEVRRAALLTASRALQLEVAVENARQDLSNLRARMAKAETGRQLQRMSQLSEAYAEVGQKRVALGLAAEAPVASEGMHSVSVVRGGETLRPNPGGVEEFELLPGDLVLIEPPGQG